MLTNRSILSWDVSTGQPLHSLLGHTDGIKVYKSVVPSYVDEEEYTHMCVRVCMHLYF